MPLTAGWVRARRVAARVTLRSSSRASSVFSRLRSSVRRSVFMTTFYLFQFTIMAVPTVDTLRFRYDERLFKGRHGLDNAGNACRGVCGWFRVLTSDSRRAIKRLSERLGITPMPVESMIDQFGKTPGNEFIRYLERPDEAHLQNAACAHLAGL